MDLNIRLRRLSEQLHAEAGRRLAATGLGLRQRWLSIYGFLLEEGPHPVMSIAAATGLSHPAVLQFAQEMMDANLVASYRDPSDRRKRVLALTAAGKQVGEDYRLYQAETNTLVVSIFEDAGVDAERLLADLERLFAERL